MSKPTGRVLAVLEILQTRSRVAGGELASAVGVDRRTVRRYIAHLVELGVPVETERGRDGGYRLSPGYKLPPLMFGPDEALALAIGLRAAAQLGLGGITPAVASAKAKLERVLPRGLERRLRDIERTVTMDLATPQADGSGVALAALSAAARAQQRVHLSYRSARGDATGREVDVYGVGYRGGAWYAVGHCHLRRGLRSFRLDRVASVEPLPASFGRPDGFDVQAHLAESIGALPRRHAVEVWLETDLARARSQIRPELARLVARDGGVRMSAQADDLGWMARELARLPFAFRILRPAGLRVALRAHVQGLALVFAE